MYKIHSFSNSHLLFSLYYQIVTNLLTTSKKYFYLFYDRSIDTYRIRLETMMKIHTTQNLSLYQTNHQSTNVVPSKEFRFLKMKDVPEDTFTRNVSFGKRIPFNKIVGPTKEKAVKAIKSAKNGKGPIDGVTNKFLEVTTKQEVLINAVVSAILAGVARPITLMLISNDKEKKDMAYASAHAISSAVWGFIIPFIFVRPLNNGYQNAWKHMNEFLTAAEIKKRHPQLDLNNPKNWKDGKVHEFDSIGKLRNIFERQEKDKKTKKIITIEGCWDTSGNKMVSGVKDPFKIPLPKNSAELSKAVYNENFDSAGNLKTLENAYFCLIDESKTKALEKERTLLDKILNRQAAEPSYFNFNTCTDEVLQEAFADLDLKSVGKQYSRNFANAKTKKGEKFNIDKAFVYISDWRETDKIIPYIEGNVFKTLKTALFSRKKVYRTKDVCYQKNGPEHGKGTQITKEMFEADGVNEIHNKIGQWLPDSIIAWPRAMATIAILPYILKNVFHLEKPSKKPAEVPVKAGA